MSARLAASRAWVRGRHRWWTFALMAVGLGVVAAWISFLVTPAASVRVGVVSAQIRAVPGTGTLVRSAEGRAVTDDAVLGGPLQVQVDVNFAPRADVAEPQVLAAITQARPRLLHGVEVYLARVAGAALLLAVVLAVLVFGWAPWRLVANGVVGVAVVAAGVGVTAGTFRPSAFDAASCAHGWSRYAVADLPELTPPAPTVTAPVEATAVANPGLVGVELISDDHLNPEGLRFARDLAHKTGVRAVLDAGDTTSFGVPGEACVVTPLVRSFGIPYVWVRGNHDSQGFERTMRLTPGVHVLDGGSTSVAGLSVWGVGDPSFTPRRTSTTAQMAANDARLRSTALDRVESASTPPDIVLVHECQMVVSAEPASPGVAGAVPLVVCGHTHREAHTTVDGTAVVHAGTVGAGGLAAFAVGGLRDFDALVLYFDATTHSLVKYYDVSAPGGRPARFVEHVMTAGSAEPSQALQGAAERRFRP